MSKITQVGIVGAGQMGGGIVQVFAASGFTVSVWDQQLEAAKAVVPTIKKRLARSVEKGVLEEKMVDSILSKISVKTTLKEFNDCQLVIEAIVEKREAKDTVFTELEKIVSANCILASNTSSISITAMASTLKDPTRFIGLHFMNPVPVMQLVEIIRGLQTSDQTYAIAVETMKVIGKTTVLGIDSPGFVVNRILCPMINEAIFLLQEGVLPEDIDTAMKLGTNQPMGPLELADFVGLDTLLYILRILHNELGEDKYRPAPLLVKYVEAGWYGRKNGRGFYTYP